MNTETQKILAAKVAGVGLSRVILDPLRYEDIKEALTKEDIRSLIKQGAIKILPARFPSRHRARARHAQQKKGRQMGHGTRRGSKYARNPRKKQWIIKIRKIRSTLLGLKEKSLLDAKTYRDLYMKAKGGFFRDCSHLKFYMESNKLLKKVKNG
jgi:large subunit ribosomal protein L19e